MIHMTPFLFESTSTFPRPVTPSKCRYLISSAPAMDTVSSRLRSNGLGLTMVLGYQANDPKLSDCGVRRGTCMVGGKAAAESTRRDTRSRSLQRMVERVR